MLEWLNVCLIEIKPMCIYVFYADVMIILIWADDDMICLCACYYCYFFNLCIFLSHRRVYATDVSSRKSRMLRNSFCKIYTVVCGL